MTLIKITNKRGYEGYIQTDFIQTIDVTKDFCRIRMNNDPDTITLTLEEWERIQPLLIPAPVSAEPSGKWHVDFDTYLARWYALKSNGSDIAYSLPAQQAFNDAYATLLGHCAAGYKAVPMSEPEHQKGKRSPFSHNDIPVLEDSILNMLRDVRRDNFDKSPYPLWLEKKESLMSQIDQYIDTDMPTEETDHDTHA